jgi:GNAT superfamily N-acetyltransferase
LKSETIQVRIANPNDIPVIYTLICKKSEFDRYVGAYSGTIQTSETKIRQTIFRTHPFAYVLLAENSQGIIGFALYGFRYSSFVGQPSIWLDDLYVEENMRGKGAGALLMVAVTTNCSRT